jgi:hypothetical protein
VAVGRRQDHDDLGWGATGWKISLNYADDGTEVASLSGFIDPGDGGSLTDQCLLYTVQAADWGRAIQIRLGGATAGSTAGYDHVRLMIGWEPLLPGDANDDGVVDDRDASILAANWLQSGAGIGFAEGDFNEDHVVNDKDAAILAAHWNETSGAGPSAPEPSVVVLFLGGLLSFLSLCKWRVK